MTPAVPSTNPNPSVFRIDKFVVPPAAMSAFMARVFRIQRLLGALPGCKQNLVLTQTGGPGEFNVVTLVEWASAQAMSDAKSSIDAQYAGEGFDPASFMTSLGVRGDLALYTVTDSTGK
jgi:hypothetical protein